MANDCGAHGYRDPIGKCAIFGVTQVVAQIGQSAVLVHGPKGCAFPAYEVTQWDRVGFNFSEMCEQNIIFGGEELLREKVWETWQDNDASVIGVITTCSSEIIGDDVRGIIADAGIPAEVLLFDGAGFKKNDTQATNDAMAVVMAALSEPGLKDGAVNLIAPVGQGPRWKDNARELKAMLEAIGIQTRLLFCENDVSHFRDAGKSELTIVASPQIGMEAAVALRDKCGIPYMTFLSPIGFGRSVNWLKSVVDALGRQVGDGVIEQMADDARRRYLRGLGRVTTFRPFEELAGLGIAIVGDPGQVDGFAALFREELEVEPSMVVTKCTEMPQQTEADSGITTCVSDYTVLKEMLRDEKPDVLLGSDIDLLLCGSTKPRVYLSIGYPGGNIVRFSPRPYWGFQGCLNFTEDLLNQLSQTRNR